MLFTFDWALQEYISFIKLPRLKFGRLNRLELIDPSADALVVGDANLTFSILLAKHREATCEKCQTVKLCQFQFQKIEIVKKDMSKNVLGKIISFHPVLVSL